MNKKYLFFDTMGPFIHFRRYRTKNYFRRYGYEPSQKVLFGTDVAFETENKLYPLW